MEIQVSDRFRSIITFTQHAKLHWIHLFGWAEGIKWESCVVWGDSGDPCRTINGTYMYVAYAPSKMSATFMS